MLLTPRADNGICLIQRRSSCITFVTPFLYKQITKARLKRKKKEKKELTDENLLRLSDGLVNGRDS